MPPSHLFNKATETTLEEILTIIEDVYDDTNHVLNVQEVTP